MSLSYLVNEGSTLNLFKVGHYIIVGDGSLDSSPVEDFIGRFWVDRWALETGVDDVVRGEVTVAALTYGIHKYLCQLRHLLFSVSQLMSG